jgi:hypothetical protein
MIDFWTLSDDEILKGLDAGRKSVLRDDLTTDSVIRAFWFSQSLQKMGTWLEECGWDRDLMRLKYSDELAEIQQHDDVLWFAPAGLNRGILSFVLDHDRGGGKSMVVDIETEIP